LGLGSKVDFGLSRLINPITTGGGKKVWIKRPEFQGLLQGSLSGRIGESHAVTFADFPEQDRWALLSGQTYKITFESDAVHVIGDPTDPNYDVAGLAEKIKREMPELSGRKFVLATPLPFDCQTRTSSGLFGSSALLTRCNLR